MRSILLIFAILSVDFLQAEVKWKYVDQASIHDSLLGKTYAGRFDSEHKDYSVLVFVDSVPAKLPVNKREWLKLAYSKLDVERTYADQNVAIFVKPRAGFLADLNSSALGEPRMTKVLILVESKKLLIFVFEDKQSAVTTEDQKIYSAIFRSLARGEKKELIKQVLENKFPPEKSSKPGTIKTARHARRY